jgi:hypothetical protein
MRCPQCRRLVMLTVQRPPGATETKRLCTPAGRFLAEYDPTTTTLVIPYRGDDYKFDLSKPETWVLQSE